MSPFVRRGDIIKLDKKIGTTCPYINMEVQSNQYEEVTFGTKKMWPCKTGDLYKMFYDRTRKR